MLSAALLPAGAPAGADSSGQVSSLQAQAAQLSRQMVLEQLLIGGYQQRYASDVERAAADQSLLSQTQERIAAAQDQVRHQSSQLAKAAVREYVQSSAATPSAALFGGQSEDTNRTVYASVVTGNLSTAIDGLRTARRELAVQRAAQVSLVAQDQVAQTQAATLLRQANSTAQQLASQQQSVSGQLAVAIAQQQQAEAATVAAALAAAPQVPGPPGSSAPSVPALPPFLVCVVHAESGGNYQVVSPTGGYMGAFQFSQSTWNYAAQLAGQPQLIGVAPNTASVADQNALAIALYDAVGEQPWYDPCRGA